MHGVGPGLGLGRALNILLLSLAGLGSPATLNIVNIHCNSWTRRRTLPSRHSALEQNS